MRKPKVGSLKRGSSKSFPVAIVMEFDVEAASEYKWTAHCPALPACFTEGRTRQEALSNIREVVAAYFDLVAEDLADKDIEVVELKT